MKPQRFLCILFILCLIFPLQVRGEVSQSEIPISAPSAILMEATTGTICYSKNCDEKRPMASVTKVMTLLLIFEALEHHQISLDQNIIISDHAASMGGSQVFLEPGEVQTVETLIKCISIASANDAAVAMAETIDQTEEAFVSHMNRRAKELHMKNTHFINCCGLDHDDHYSTAKDLALVTRELIISHPQIFKYCNIWQEDITHQTKKGVKPFTLTNTNKLLKQYPYATGLKTGSTSQAKFCLSATASKDNMQFIAVIMAAQTPKERFSDARTLLNYGFSNTTLYTNTPTKESFSIDVKKGMKKHIPLYPKGNFHYLALQGENIKKIHRKIIYKKQQTAPIKKGTTLGSIKYYLGDKVIGTIPLIAAENVPKATVTHYLKQMTFQFFCQDSK